MIRQSSRQQSAGIFKRGGYRIAAVLLLIALGAPAAAQDVRGLEVCTAEKQMERRTSCLQSNVEFLQRALARVQRETQDKLAASGRELAVANAEIAALKSALAKLEVELTALKGKPVGKLK